MAQSVACWWPSIVNLKTGRNQAAAVAHCNFLLEAHLLTESIRDELEPDSAFKECLSELPRTASFLYGQHMDLPFHFEVFLPIRVPMNPFTAKQPRHPSFGNSNSNYATCVNTLLEHELKQAIAKLGSVYSFVYKSVVYDLSYRAQRRDRVPFMHQILAVERATGERSKRRCLRFDFILAAQFEGPGLPPSPYYKGPPIKAPWLAYGQLGVVRNGSPAELSRIFPKWQAHSVAVTVRCRNLLIGLRHILYAQLCHNYAVPGALKLGFATVVEAIDGMGYQLTSSLQLTVMIMQKLLEQNIFGLHYVTDAWNVKLHAGHQRKRVQAIIKVMEFLMKFGNAPNSCASCGGPCCQARAPPRR